MQYLLLIYESPKAFDVRDENTAGDHFGAWRTYYQSLVKAGVYVGGNPLQTPDTGTTVRVKEGKRSIQDGPYANTKEQLGGVILLEVSSLDAALEWAARCPAASYGAVEVRPVSPEVHERVTSD